MPNGVFVYGDMQKILKLAKRVETDIDEKHLAFHFVKKTVQGHVACKELGFAQAIAVTTESFYGPVSGSAFSFNNVKCRGDESSINDCPNTKTDNCDSSEGAGVVCDPGTSSSLLSGTASSLPSWPSWPPWPLWPTTTSVNQNNPGKAFNKH